MLLNHFSIRIPGNQGRMGIFEEDWEIVHPPDCEHKERCAPAGIFIREEGDEEI